MHAWRERPSRAAQVRAEELPSLFTAALCTAERSPRWQGVADETQPPVLLLGGAGNPVNGGSWGRGRGVERRGRVAEGEGLQRAAEALREELREIEEGEGGEGGRAGVQAGRQAFKKAGERGMCRLLG